jgi:signal peptidase I
MQNLNNNPENFDQNNTETNPGQNQTKFKKRKQDWSLKEFLVFALITVAIVIPIRFWVAQPFIVSGASMSPTFETGQYIIVDQLSYQLNDPNRGDVVVFRFPQDPSKYFIKRIIGLPGETLKLNGQDVIIKKIDGTEMNANEIDGVILDEPYIRFQKNTYSEITLESDEYYVMGDNRLESLDSRIWGPLKKEYMLGRAFIRLLPIAEIDYLPGSTEYDQTNI